MEGVGTNISQRQCAVIIVFARHNVSIAEDRQICIRPAGGKLIVSKTKSHCRQSAVIISLKFIVKGSKRPFKVHTAAPDHRSTKGNDIYPKTLCEIQYPANLMFVVPHHDKAECDTWMFHSGSITLRHQ